MRLISCGGKDNGCETLSRREDDLGPAANSSGGGVGWSGGNCRAIHGGEEHIVEGDGGECT